MRIGGVRHRRLPFGTKRELLVEDGGCRKMVSGSRRGAEEKGGAEGHSPARHPGLDPGSRFMRQALRQTEKRDPGSGPG